MRFDQHHRIRDISIGEYVMLKDVERRSKLDPVYQGPYKITSKTLAGTYSDSQKWPNVSHFSLCNPISSQLFKLKLSTFTIICFYIILINSRSLKKTNGGVMDI